MQAVPNGFTLSVIDSPGNGLVQAAAKATHSCSSLEIHRIASGSLNILSFVGGIANRRPETAADRT
jgi:hypothetical protein